MEIHQKKFTEIGSNDQDLGIKHAIDVDIIESNEALVLYFDLPGFAISDIKMMVSMDGILKVSAYRNIDFSSLESALLSERLMGEFYKEIVLPQGLNFENPKSSMENGVLKLELFKV